MSSICFFSSYFSGKQIPYYVKIYVQELSNYFSEIVFLTNKKQLAESELNYLSENKIQLRLYDNEGWDFGMWYKALNEFNVTNYDRIGLINDSCILFKKLKFYFDWLNTTEYDFCGLVETGKIANHIQSYFLVVNKNAISETKKYLTAIGIKNTYREAISECEIGLSQHLISKGFQMKGYFDYSSRKDANPSFILAEDLILKGSPIIKKKIISHNYYLGDYLTWFRNKFNIDHKFYIELIKKQNANNLIIDLDRVVSEVCIDKSNVYLVKYKLGLKIYSLLSRSKILRAVFHWFIGIRRQLRVN